MKETLLTIAMPVYNQRQYIEEIVSNWITSFEQYFAKGDVFKFVIVDNGSTDGTTELLRDLQKAHPERLELVTQQHKDYSTTLINAYNKALECNPEFVFQVDGDASFIPTEFHKLWERHQIGQLVLGKRNGHKDASLKLRLLAQYLYGVKVKDLAIPYRIYNAKFLKKLLELMPSNLPSNPNVFMALMAKYAGVGLHNVAIKHKPKSSGNYKGSKSLVSDVLKYRSYIKKQYEPLVPFAQPVNIV